MLTFFAVYSDILRGSRLVILTSIAVDPDVLRGLKMTFPQFKRVIILTNIAVEVRVILTLLVKCQENL
jgi:hypothetical protein